jgi:hypothetical protein
VNEKECRRIVRARAGLGDPDDARCERCGAPPPLTMHHRRNRSQGGQWVPSNIVALCGDGVRGDHGWVGANPTEANAQGWSLRAGDDPLVVPVLHHGLGMRVRLDDEGMLIPV